MAKPGTIRRYGKQVVKPKGDRLFAELPQTPVRPRRTRQSIATGAYTTGAVEDKADVIMEKLAKGLSTVTIRDENTPPPEDIPSDTEASPQPCSLPQTPRRLQPTQRTPQSRTAVTTPPRSPSLSPSRQLRDEIDKHASEEAEEDEYEGEPTLRILSWSEVCPLGDRIVKIAEASYAEVYRVTNERGTSIIKVIRMESPIKPQTKQQQNARLVDELPHSEADLVGELKISQLLADIPGFVMYKERYIVQGKTSRQLLETHQAFQRRIKRKDPGRLQFYPSPSRYLDDTKFLVVELGDAGTALEDFDVVSSDQMFDIFLHCAIALARAEARVEFEHRDLHEGNLCIRRVGEAVPVEERDRPTCFGFSGLDITILDYGISRASIYTEDEDGNEVGEAIAYDMERDLSLFRSEHAPQCQVYRRMRSFLLRDDRECLPPSSHATPYETGVDGPIDWKVHEPYTNVLWLAYLFEYMTSNFRGPKKELAVFRQTVKNLWHHLDPDAGPEVPGFESASDIVRYAVESGWVDEDQLMGGRDEIEKSILSVIVDEHGDQTDLSVRRSPRKQRS